MREASRAKGDSRVVAASDFFSFNVQRRENFDEFDRAKGNREAVVEGPAVEPWLEDPGDARRRIDAELNGGGRGGGFGGGAGYGGGFYGVTVSAATLRRGSEGIDRRPARRRRRARSVPARRRRRRGGGGRGGYETGAGATARGYREPRGDVGPAGFSRIGSGRGDSRGPRTEATSAGARSGGIRCREGWATTASGSERTSASIPPSSCGSSRTVTSDVIGNLT